MFEKKLKVENQLRVCFFLGLSPKPMFVNGKTKCNGQALLVVQCLIQKIFQVHYTPNFMSKISPILCMPSRAVQKSVTIQSKF